MRHELPQSYPGYDAVVVGTGHGGATAAIALRQQGFAGTIAMIGKDRNFPYERPPLSKGYLARDCPFERILIRPESFWVDNGIEIVRSAEVVRVDAAGRNVILGDGRVLGYQELIWSAGGAARRLACRGGDLDGVHVIRDKADVDRIATELASGARRVVVIGGGYIGLEAAAVLTGLGCQVSLLEAADRVLSRVTGTDISLFFQSLHRAKGVDLRLECALDSVEGEQGRVKAVRPAMGEALICDLVIVGIGIEPAVAPLANAGAAISDGVNVDEFCRTSLPHIHAIGDCAAHRNGFAGGTRVRLESVQNATDMAVVAAKDICGKAEPYTAMPWFWSDQYDLKLQTAGLSQGHDATVLRGNPAEGSFSVIYLKERKIIAIDCVNAMKDYVQGRKLVAARAEIAPKRLADANTPFNKLLN